MKRKKSAKYADPIPRVPAQGGRATAGEVGRASLLGSGSSGLGAAKRSVQNCSPRQRERRGGVAFNAPQSFNAPSPEAAHAQFACPRRSSRGRPTAHDGSPMRQSQAIGGRSATVLLSVDDRHRRIVQSVRESCVNGESGRNRIAPASRPGWASNRAAAMIAPLSSRSRLAVRRSCSGRGMLR